MEKSRSPHYVLGFTVSLITGIIGFIISNFIDKDARRGGLFGFLIHLVIVFVIVAIIVLIYKIVK